MEDTQTLTIGAMLESLIACVIVDVQKIFNIR
jgi:hypothetical protein